jgi:GT2 family glycosyltransferase
MEKLRSNDHASVSTRGTEPLETVLSVCIVTYQACQLLEECLKSLYSNTNLNFEIIVIDNGSNDGVGWMLEQQFPSVSFIQNPNNVGFTRPMNQALRSAKGRYLLQLNPDTVIPPHALDELVIFMESHSDAGICGPKVLNRDGTLQKPCRRGDARPWAVISYVTGLSNLFPRSKFFSQYLMSYLDENQTHPVDGVSGSCMLIRRNVIEQIGYLDERFFAYQEDADFCLRARLAGWLVYYVPQAKIIHYGNLGGSQVQPYRSIYEWHRSYFLYYRKHFSRDYLFIFNWFFYGAMFLKLLLTLLVNMFRRNKYPGARKP